MDTAGAFAGARSESDASRAIMALFTCRTRESERGAGVKRLLILAVSLTQERWRLA